MLPEPEHRPAPQEVTLLLRGLASERDADRLIELVYGELRSLAAAQMAAEPAGHTLQPTALVDEALAELESFDPRMAELVSLRWFSGLDVEETATAMELSTRTIKREWSVAKAWLATRLADGDLLEGGAG